jgi:rhombotail lipoprotein
MIVPRRPHQAACVVGLAASALLVSGCTTTQLHRATSVVDYLYPRERAPIAAQGIPELHVPMRAAIAFVPDASPRSGATSALTEEQKLALLERVAARFRALDVVDSIERIPSAYLTPGGGFANLDQIATMFGVETIALVSYDQTQFTDAGFGRVALFTVVGAFFVPSEKNATHTMLDTVVVHVPSRKLLFRAPGTSQVRSEATLRAQARELRADGGTGFTRAAGAMIENLDAQLAVFRERVKARPEEYRVVKRAGFRGVGALRPGSALLLLAAPLAAAMPWPRRRS